MSYPNPPGGPHDGGRPDWLAARFAEADRLMNPPGRPPMDWLVSQGRTRRARRRAAWSGGLAAAVAAVIALVAALVPGGSPHATTRVATRPSPSTPGPVRYPTTTTPTTAPPSLPGGCRSSDLTITEKAVTGGHYVSGALGHSSVTVLFKNTGSRTCTLAGYPGAAGLNGSGAQIVQAQRTPTGYMGGLTVVPPAGATPSTPAATATTGVTPASVVPTVTLGPGRYASAVVEGLDAYPDGSSASCPTLAGLLVTAPNTRASVRLPAAPADCAGLQVHPVVPGATGRQQPDAGTGSPTGGTTTGSTITGSTTTGAVPACRSMDLRITEAEQPTGFLNYAAGHSAAVILFTDTSGAPCTLQGYPGAAGLDPAGAEITQAYRSPTGYMGGLAAGVATPPALTLQPGQAVSAMVEGTDIPAAPARSCPTLSALVVTAPDTRTSVRLPAAPQDCSGLQVHPVVAGTTGTQQP